MKTLVVFFSRSGRTRKAAQALAGLLGADCEELVERGVERGGVTGYLRSGRDALQKRPAELEPLKHEAAAYDLVVLGSPVWAFTLCPAVRTYLAAQAGSIRKAAFLSTHGGGGPAKSYKEAETLLGRPLVATLALRDKAVDAGEADPELAAFAKTLMA
jgi:menaquinone-dependent protoporphyrinogen IX oxidase